MVNLRNRAESGVWIFETREQWTDNLDGLIIMSKHFGIVSIQSDDTESAYANVCQSRADLGSTQPTLPPTAGKLETVGCKIFAKMPNIFRDTFVHFCDYPWLHVTGGPSGGRQKVGQCWSGCTVTGPGHAAHRAGLHSP